MLLFFENFSASDSVKLTFKKDKQQKTNIQETASN